MPNNCETTNGQWVVYSNAVGSGTSQIFIPYEDLSDLAKLYFRIKTNLNNDNFSSYSNSDLIACITPTPSRTPTRTIPATPTPTRTSTSTITVTPTRTITSSPTSTLQFTATPTPTITPTISITPTITPTLTRTSTLTPTITPTSTITPTLTPTLSQTPTLTPTITKTSTRTSTVTRTCTPTLTNTSTTTRTLTPTSTITSTITPTASPTTTLEFTPTPTATITSTVTPTITTTETLTPTPTVTSSLTNTPTSSITLTPTMSLTLSQTPTITNTISSTPTLTPTITETPTLTTTITETPTLTPTLTETPTLTPTITETPTVTPSASPAQIITNLFLQMNSSDPFVDSINENRVITANGTATISTEIKYAGAASLSLGPAELEPISYLSTPHNSDFDLSGDFTIDFYIYPTAIPSAGFSYIFITSQSTDGFFITWDQYDNNTINIGQVGTADILVSTDPAPINEWTRITITRELDLIKIFINSVLSSSAENSTNFTSDSSNEARFGEGENVGAGAGFIGYIDEFKLINGTAVNPTPPPSPTPSITPTITKTKTPTPTVTKTPTPSFTPMTIDICQSGPTINLGSGRSTGYYNYVGSGCITNRVINLSGSTGGGTLISSGSGPLIFTSNITSAGIGNKAFTLGGNNTGRNRVNRLRDPSPGGGSNGRVRLVKDGSGSWEITGASGNYSGGTTISEGTLIVSGANVSGVANGPLGIGSITIGNSGTNSTDSAFLLLEENVNFNRNINLRNIPQKNVIIGGANVSGTCTFGSGVSFIPSQVASYGELYIVSSTGGEVKIQSDLNTLDSKYTNTQIIFGLKNQTYDGKIVIETAIAGKANKLMNLLFNSGNTALTKANTFTGSSVIKNGIAIAEVNSPIDGNGAFGYSLNGGLGGGSSPPIVLGDETDFSDGLAGLLLDKGAQFGRIVMIPELGIESTQKVVIGGANTSGITRFQSTATFFVNRDIILQCANSGIVNISCGFLKGEPGDFDSLTSSFIIGSSGNSGTVLLSGNLNTSGSVSVEYGTLEVTGTLYGAQGIIITGKNAVLKYNSDLIELSSDISININNSGSLTGFGNIFGEIIINNSGILNPGDDILRNIIPTYHKLILNSGGKLKTKIFDNSTFNQAIVSDSGIFINSTENNPFIIEIDPFDGISTNSFTILANSATLDGFDANKFNIVNNNPLVSGTFGLEASSSNIVLTYTDP